MSKTKTRYDVLMYRNYPVKSMHDLVQRKAMTLSGAVEKAIELSIEAYELRRKTQEENIENGRYELVKLRKYYIKPREIELSVKERKAQ